MSGPRQLALDWPARISHAREDFLQSSSNAAALALVDRWTDWPDGRALLIGPPGSGKTHLAAIWAQAAGGRTIGADGLAAAGIPGLVAGGALAVDNADTLGGGREADLFHLLNLARETATPLLLTASGTPEAWGLATPDLLSRLRAMQQARLDLPDDALLRAVLVKLFLDRQIAVDAGVVDTLMRRMERSLAAARALVADLDREALSQGRRITRAMAAAFAGRQPPDT